MKRLTILLAGPALGLTLAACGGSDSASDAERRAEDMAASQGIDADVETDADGNVSDVTINAGMGGQVGTNLNLPEGFPDDVEFPDGVSIIATTPVPGGDGFSVQAMGDMSVEDMTSAITANMTGNGWTAEDGGMMTPQMSRLPFTKDDRMATFTIIDGDRPTVQLVTMTMPG